MTDNWPDEELIYTLAEKLTGASRITRRPLVVSRVTELVVESGYQDLRGYLLYALQDQNELARLISCLTIHTTSWFRERLHFDLLQTMLENSASSGKQFNALSAGCSTGQEVYSLGLLLIHAKRQQLINDFRVSGWDIDPLSLKLARMATFAKKELAEIPESLRAFLNFDCAEQERFSLDQAILDRTNFQTTNLLRISEYATDYYDLIFCKNVLIYFSPVDTLRVVDQLSQRLKPEGILYLGLSESIGSTNLPHLIRVSPAIYKVDPAYKAKSTQVETKVSLRKSSHRLLIVEDDIDTADIYAEELLESGFHVTRSSAVDHAIQLIDDQNFDLLIADLILRPGSGMDILRAIRSMGKRIPSIMISGFASQEVAMEAMNLGCINVISKPIRIGELSALAMKALNHGSFPLDDQREPVQLIVCGSSTGGPLALSQIFRDIPQDFPPIVIVQHMKVDFFENLDRQLAEDSGRRVLRVSGAMTLERGTIYLAGMDAHLLIKREKSQLIVSIEESEKVNEHRPSIDRLFMSCAQIGMRSIIAILLTGMGKDGALGLSQLYQKGAWTLVQDEASSTVFGMPRHAIELGAAHKIGNPSRLRDLMIERIAACESPRSKQRFG